MTAESTMPRPRLAFLFVPLVLVGLSIIAFAAGVSGQWQADDTYSGLVRFDSGQPKAVDVAAPGRQWVWIRHDDYGGPGATTLTVARQGNPFPVHRLPGDVTYQDTDTAVTAVWAFDAEQPGEHTLTATSGNYWSQFLVGTGNPQAELQKAVRLQKTGAMGIVLSLALLVALVSFRRRQTRQRFATHDQPGQLSRVL